MFNHRPVTLPEIQQINGKWQRHYACDAFGVRFPSITTVLQKTKDNTFLHQWRERVGEEEANRIAKRATTRGTAMHSLCEDLVMNRELRQIDDVVAAELFEICVPYLQKHVDNIRGCEIALISQALGIGGTTDLVAEHDGTLAVIDYKSSGKLKKFEWIEDYFLQSAFYAMAFRELTGELPKKAVVMIAVEEHEDWRGVLQPAQIQDFVLGPSEIIQHVEKLRERKREYDKLFPPAPQKVL